MLFLANKHPEIIIFLMNQQDKKKIKIRFFSLIKLKFLLIKIKSNGNIHKY